MLILDKLLVVSLDELMDLILVSAEALVCRIEVPVVQSRDASHVAEDLALLSKNGMQTKDMIDLLRIAPLQNRVEQVDEARLAFQFLSGIHQVVEPRRECFEAEGLGARLGVEAEGGVKHPHKCVVLALTDLPPPLDAFLEELEGVVDVAVLEEGLCHRDEVGH